MRQLIHRSGIIILFIPALLVLTNCRGGGSISSPPPITPTGAPAPPASIIATAVSPTQVNISWSGVSDAASYSVYRSEQSGTAYTYTLAAGTTATIVSDSSVTSGKTYYYVVSGTNSFGEGPRSAEVSVAPAAPSGTLTIAGAIKYEDKEYDHIVGHTGKTSFKAVRFAEVELVGVSTDTTLWSTTTDSSGVYSISTANTGTTVYVRVLSTAAPVGANTVSVKDLGSQPALYAVKTANFTLGGDTTVNLSIPTTNPADGAFNILDVMTSGFKFVETYAATPLHDLNAFWQPDNPYGTYYCTGYDPYDCIRGAGIYVYSVYSSLDTDEFDDDVLWHEFGHFIAHKFSKDDSPGGVHYLDDNTQDLRLSWSEGWGSFFPTAVKFWLNVNAPELLSADPGTPLSQYVDTVIDGLYLTVNIGNPESTVPYQTCSNDECKYASNEISNANVLWNVMNDTTNLGMTKIWDVMENYLSGVAHAVNIEDFWDGWLIRNGTSDQPALTSVFSARSITYATDLYGESDNSIVTAQPFSVGSSQVHTLYTDPTTTTVGDVDYVMFTVPTFAAQYTIKTDNLRNGVDTYITLYDSNGNLLNSPHSNDNTDGITYIPFPNYGYNYNYYDYNGIYIFPENNSTMLSSRIQRILSPGTYYLSVKSSPFRPMSAGRYGSYTLTITQP